MIGFLRNGLTVAAVALMISLFDADSRAEDQQNQAQVAKSPQESQIEQLKEEIEAIQRQNQKQIEELKKKIEDLEAQKVAPPPAPPPSETFLKNFDAGYKEGFYLKTKDNRFSLKF